MLSKLKYVLVTVVCLAGLPAFADNYDFNLNNRANGWTINGFYTFQDGRWSKNWLQGSRVRPGQRMPMNWNSQSGDCVVPFRVSWVDFGSQDFTMNWCKNNPTNIYMKDEGFTWD